MIWMEKLPLLGGACLSFSFKFCEWTIRRRSTFWTEIHSMFLIGLSRSLNTVSWWLLASQWLDFSIRKQPIQIHLIGCALYELCVWLPSRAWCNPRKMRSNTLTCFEKKKHSSIVIIQSLPYRSQLTVITSQAQRTHTHTPHALFVFHSAYIRSAVTAEYNT